MMNTSYTFIPPDMLVKYDNSLYMVIHTRESFYEHLPEIFQILDSFVQYIQDIGKYKAKIGIMFPPFKSKSQKLTPLNLKKLKIMLEEKQVQNFMIYEENQEDIYRNGVFNFSMSFKERNIFSGVNTTQTNAIAVSFTDRFLLQNQIDKNDLCIALKNEMMKLYNQFDGVYAFMGYSTYTGTYDTDLTWFELPIVQNIWEASSHFDTCVRGYYWAQILSPKHLERVPELTKCSNEHLIIEKLDDGSMYIQLSKDIFRAELEDYRELRNLLIPLFPEKSKIGLVYLSEIIEDEELRGFNYMLFREDMHIDE